MFGFLIIIYHIFTQAEMEVMKEQLRVVQNENLRDKDELQQLRSLYKVIFVNL